MKKKVIKGTALYGVEADNLDEAQELAADEAFLKSLVEAGNKGVKVKEIKCTGVEEAGPRFYDLTCTLHVEAPEGTDLGLI